MNFVVAILVILIVGYLIVKKYHAQGVLIIGGAALLLGGILLNNSPVMEKSATGSLYLDIFAQLSKNFIKTSGSLGLAIMIVSAFAKYMDHIGASNALVKLSIKPLQKLNSPYIVLALSYVVGQILNVFIPSASGLGVLLMVTVYPILVSLGVSSLAATSVIGTAACLDLGPASGNAVLASKTAEMDAALYFANYQIPVAIVTVIVITILHYIVNKKMDAKLDTTSFNSNIESKEEEKEVPKFYAFLPIIPLLIILVFSPLTGSSIKIDVVEAMFMSITLSMIIEGIRRKAFKSTLAELCAAGMSTSLLVTKMIKAAEEKNIQVKIEACPVEKFNEKLNEFDIFLLGPQVRFKQADLNNTAAEYNKKVEVINMVDYGTMNGAKVLEAALKALDAK